MTGLHCGDFANQAVFAVPSLFPVSMTGLHCGKEARGGDDWIEDLFPVSMAGLHCGPFVVETVLGLECFSRFQ